MLRIGFTNLNLTQPTTRFAFPYNILRDPSTLCVHDREIPQPSQSTTTSYSCRDYWIALLCELSFTQPVRPRTVSRRAG